MKKILFLIAAVPLQIAAQPIELLPSATQSQIQQLQKNVSGDVFAITDEQTIKVNRDLQIVGVWPKARILGLSNEVAPLSHLDGGITQLGELPSQISARTEPRGALFSDRQISPITRFDVNGNIVWQQTMAGALAITAGKNESVWAASSSALLHIDANGRITQRINVPRTENAPYATQAKIVVDTNQSGAAIYNIGRNGFIDSSTQEFSVVGFDSTGLRYVYQEKHSGNLPEISLLTNGLVRLVYASSLGPAAITLDRNGKLQSRIALGAASDHISAIHSRSDGRFAILMSDQAQQQTLAQFNEAAQLIWRIPVRSAGAFLTSYQLRGLADGYLISLPVFSGVIPESATTRVIKINLNGVELQTRTLNATFGRSDFAELSDGTLLYSDDFGKLSRLTDEFENMAEKTLSDLRLARMSADAVFVQADKVIVISKTNGTRREIHGVANGKERWRAALPVEIQAQHIDANQHCALLTQISEPTATNSEPRTFPALRCTQLSSGEQHVLAIPVRQGSNPINVQPIHFQQPLAQLTYSENAFHLLAGPNARPRSSLRQSATHDYLLSFNANGERVYDAQLSPLFAAKMHADGSVTGETEPSAKGQNANLLHYDPTGNLRWRSVLDASCGAVHRIESNDGSTLLIYQKEQDEFAMLPQFPTLTCIARFNAQGVRMWQHRLADGFASIASFSWGKDAAYFIDVDQAYAFRLSKFDWQNGQIAWRKSIASSYLFSTYDSENGSDLQIAESIDGRTVRVLGSSASGDVISSKLAVETGIELRRDVQHPGRSTLPVVTRLTSDAMVTATNDLSPNYNSKIELAATAFTSSPFASGFGYAQLQGAWHHPSRPGQGLMFDVREQIVRGVWYRRESADSLVGGASSLVWYRLEGRIEPFAELIQLEIYRDQGGTFAGSSASTAQRIGQATMRLAQCGSASFEYKMSGLRVGSNDRGAMPLQALLRANGCEAQARDKVGAWRAANGEQMMIDINPTNQTVFAGWFSFDPNGLADDAHAQNWFNLVGTMAENGVASAKIYRTTGPVFGQFGATTSHAIGTAELQWNDTGDLMVRYAFDQTAESAPYTNLAGSLNLTKQVQ